LQAFSDTAGTAVEKFSVTGDGQTKLTSALIDMTAAKVLRISATGTTGTAGFTGTAVSIDVTKESVSTFALLKVSNCVTLRSGHLNN
jgi:hypothetical protein